MNDIPKFHSVVRFLWAIADRLHGACKKSEFQQINLPLSVRLRLGARGTLTAKWGRETAGGPWGIAWLIF